MLVPRISTYHHRFTSVTLNQNHTLSLRVDDGTMIYFDLNNEMSLRLLGAMCQELGLDPLMSSQDLVGQHVPVATYLHWKRIGQDRSGRQLFA